MDTQTTLKHTHYYIWAKINERFDFPVELDKYLSELLFSSDNFLRADLNEDELNFLKTTYEVNKKRLVNRLKTAQKTCVWANNFYR